MKSITIHNLDDSLDTLIRKKAKKSGLSLNKTIKILLKESLGLKEKEIINNKNEFIELYNIWDENDEAEFKKNTASLNEINKMDWE